MEIIKCNHEPQWSNMYILKEGSHAVLIDPCRGSGMDSADIDVVNGCRVDYILLTHEHYDHISGVNYWKDITGAKVVCSGACSCGLTDPSINLSSIFQQFCAIQSVRDIDLAAIQNVDYVCQADITYESNYELQWEGNSIEFFVLPGHSAGSSGILANNLFLFAGDSLLRDYPVTGCFVGSSGADWQKISLPQLKRLPKNLHVYPGHFEDFALQDYRFWDEGKFRRERRR